MDEIAEFLDAFADDTVFRLRAALWFRIPGHPEIRRSSIELFQQRLPDILEVLRQAFHSGLDPKVAKPMQRGLIRAWVRRTWNQPEVRVRDKDSKKRKAELAELKNRVRHLEVAASFLREPAIADRESPEALAFVYPALAASLDEVGRDYQRFLDTCMRLRGGIQKAGTRGARKSPEVLFAKACAKELRGFCVIRPNSSPVRLTPIERSSLTHRFLTALLQDEFTSTDLDAALAKGRRRAKKRPGRS